MFCRAIGEPKIELGFGFGSIKYFCCSGLCCVINFGKDEGVGFFGDLLDD